MKKYRENTNTEKNLNNVLSAEALNLAKYMVWGDKAERDGYPQIAVCYKDAVRNGLARSGIWMGELGLLNDESLNIPLQMATNAEKEMSEKMKAYASSAEDEGYDFLRDKFLDAGKSYENQMKSFERINEELISDNMFTSDCDNALWRCYNCGYTEAGESPPDQCPLCTRGETWFVRIDR